MISLKIAFISTSVGFVDYANIFRLAKSGTRSERMSMIKTTVNLPTATPQGDACLVIHFVYRWLARIRNASALSGLTAGEIDITTSLPGGATVFILTKRTDFG